MVMLQTGYAGTMESSDIHITIEPSEDSGIQVYLKSPVISQFGDEINNVIIETLRKVGIKNAVVRAVDMGALNCTIEARTFSAAMRATGKEMAIWEVSEHA